MGFFFAFWPELGGRVGRYIDRVCVFVISTELCDAIVFSRKLLNCIYIVQYGVVGFWSPCGFYDGVPSMSVLSSVNTERTNRFLLIS